MFVTVTEPVEPASTVPGSPINGGSQAHEPSGSPVLPGGSSVTVHTDPSSRSVMTKSGFTDGVMEPPTTGSSVPYRHE